MKTKVLAIFLMVSGFMYVFAPSVHAEGFQYTLSGIVYEQPSYFAVKDDSLLNPDNQVLQFSNWSNRFYGRVNLVLQYNNLKLVTQTRPTLSSTEGKNGKFDFITDDAYLDMNFTDKYFLYVGKRNVRDGVAYGAHPTDFLGENKAVDFTKREEERRIERKGNYLVGGDVYFKNLTLTAIYAPKIDDWQEEKDRFLLKGSLLLERINTDMSVHLFYGDIPGVGVNVATTVNDNLVLHTESALRWGSNKAQITVTNPGSDTSPRLFEITNPADRSRVYPNIVVGGTYTFGDGTNLTGEYIYNGQGYNSEEWSALSDYIKYNNRAFRSNFFSDLAQANLAQASSLMKFREMRRNYIFVRVSNSKAIQNVDGQIAAIYNADDSSFLISPLVDYKISNNLIAGMSMTVYEGKKDSEFGLMYWGWEASVVLRYYF